MPFATKPGSRTAVHMNLDILGMGENAKVIVTSRKIKKRGSSTEVMAPPNFRLFNYKIRGNQINSNYFEIKVTGKMLANCSRMTASLLQGIENQRTNVVTNFAKINQLKKLNT